MFKKIKKQIKKIDRWLDFNPPTSLTSRGWNLFRREFKEKAPIRYWLYHTSYRQYILPIKWKYEAIKEWIYCRVLTRYHVLKTGLPPGYAEIDTIMLNANFNMLKEFVEVNLARRYFWNSDSIKKSWCQMHLPFYDTVFEFRNPDYGLKHLEWEMTLDDPKLPTYEQSPTQAKNAREIFILYNWWVKDRPAREPIVPRRPKVEDEDEGLTSLSDMDDNSKEYKIYVADIKASYKQEDKWDKQDDTMLVRLMKVRRALW